MMLPLPTSLRQLVFCTLAFVLVATLLGGITACGKKKPPEPVAMDEKFAWFKQRLLVEDGCMLFTGIVYGKTHNIDEILLLIEDPAEKMCPGCPFFATRIVRISPTDKSIRIEEMAEADANGRYPLYIRLSRCGMFADTSAASLESLRMKVAITNRLRTMPTEMGPLLQPGETVVLENPYKAFPKEENPDEESPGESPEESSEESSEGNNSQDLRQTEGQPEIQTGNQPHDTTNQSVDTTE